MFDFCDINFAETIGCIQLKTQNLIGDFDKNRYPKNIRN